MSWNINKVLCPKCGNDLTEYVEDMFYDIVTNSDTLVFCIECGASTAFDIEVDLTLKVKK